MIPVICGRGKHSNEHSNGLAVQKDLEEETECLSLRFRHCRRVIPIHRIRILILFGRTRTNLARMWTIR
jgi:hypothetical protein